MGAPVASSLLASPDMPTPDAQPPISHSPATSHQPSARVPTLAAAFTSHDGSAIQATVPTAIFTPSAPAAAPSPPPTAPAAPSFAVLVKVMPMAAGLEPCTEVVDVCAAIDDPLGESLTADACLDHVAAELSLARARLSLVWGKELVEGRQVLTALGVANSSTLHCIVTEDEMRSSRIEDQAPTALAPSGQPPAAPLPQLPAPPYASLSSDRVVELAVPAVPAVPANAAVPIMGEAKRAPMAALAAKLAAELAAGYAKQRPDTDT